MTSRINDILTELYSDTQLEECLRKYVSADHRDDFRQELFMRLMRHPDTVTQAHERGELRYYTVRVIINMSRDLHRKTNYTEEITDKAASVPCEASGELEVRKLEEDRQDQLIRQIRCSETKLGTPYYRLLAEAIMEHGTAGKVAKATGIPRRSVYNGVEQLRKFLENDD